MVFNYYAAMAYSNMPAQDKGTTWYHCPIGAGVASMTTEADTSWKARAAYTVKNLSIRVVSNTISGGSSTFSSRKNGASGNLSISIGAGVTGLLQDTTHSDSLEDGDLYNYEMDVYNGGTSLEYTLAVAQFQTSTNAGFLGAGGEVILVAMDEPYYYSVIASASVTATESSAQYRTRVAGTLSNLLIYIVASMEMAGFEVTLRINGAAGNLVVTVPAMETGYFEDTTHSDSLAVEDLVNVEIGVGLLFGVLQFGIPHALKFVCDDQLIGTGSGDLTTVSAGLIRYSAFGETSVGINATESDTQAPVLFTHTLRNMCVNVPSYSLNEPAQVTLRKNGADAALTVTVNATGFFEDTTHQERLAVPDLIDIKVDASAASSGNVGISLCGYQLGQFYPAPPGLTPVLDLILEG